MPALSTDKFKKVGKPGTATTLASPGHTIGGTSITVASTTNWPTDTGVTFAIDRAEIVGGVEQQVSGSYTVWHGVVTSATTIGSMTLSSDSPNSDQNYSAGSLTRVYIPISTSVWNEAMDGVLVEHTQTGSHVMTSPKVITGINDTNGNELIKVTATTSAVNEITVANAATGNNPSISATGGDTNISLNLKGKGTGKPTIGSAALQIYPYDYVVSGCVWSGDAYASTRNASMTSGTVVINGNPLTVAAVTARSFTASKDTYIDASDNGDGTALLTYTEVANNAASPALAANSLRLGIIVTGASNIASAGSVNQGEETKVLPIASSIPYAVTDSLGNLICPRDPNRKILGYRQITSASTNSTQADVTGLSCPVIVPANRKVAISFGAYNASDTIASGAGNKTIFIMEGATQLTTVGPTTSLGSGFTTAVGCSVLTSPTSGLHTYKIQSASTSGTITINAASNAPAYIKVELV